MTINILPHTINVDRFFLRRKSWSSVRLFYGAGGSFRPFGPGGNKCSAVIIVPVPGWSDNSKDFRFLNRAYTVSIEFAGPVFVASHVNLESIVESTGRLMGMFETRILYSRKQDALLMLAALPIKDE